MAQDVKATDPPFPLRFISTLGCAAATWLCRTTGCCKELGGTSPPDAPGTADAAEGVVHVVWGRWIGLVGWGGVAVCIQRTHWGVASGALFGPVGCFEDFGRVGLGVKFQNDSKKNIRLATAARRSGFLSATMVWR